MTEATNSTDELREDLDDVAEATDDIEVVRAQLEEAQSLYARARADYANLERRSQEQRLEVGRAALTEAVRGFLPVFDDLQRAVEAAEADTGSPSGMLEGVRLVAQKFKTTLQQHGVEEVSAMGEAFDPTKHEAVGAAPGPEGIVVHVLQRGYTLRDRVIRPAMVMVGNGADAP